jgi:hypothetical protein
LIADTKKSVSIDLRKEVKKGVAEEEGVPRKTPYDEAKKGEAYSEDPLSLCEHFLHNPASRPRSFSAIRAFCRQNKGDISFGQLTALVNAGKVKQSRDGYWMDEPEE